MLADPLRRCCAFCGRSLARLGVSRLRLSACASLLLLTGCPEENTRNPPRLMAIPKEQDAISFVQHFFDAYVHVDVDSVSRMICEQDPESLGQVRAFIQHSQAEASPFRVVRYQVRSAVPMWIGKEPYFRVEVSFPRKAGRAEILHQYRVRVRDGCLEGLLEPGPGPRPSPPPVGSGVERQQEDAPIELLGEGDSAEGDSAEGDSAEGDSAEGDSADSAEGNSADSAEGAAVPPAVQGVEASGPDGEQPERADDEVIIEL